MNSLGCDDDILLPLNKTAIVQFLSFSIGHSSLTFLDVDIPTSKKTSIYFYGTEVY